LGGLKVQVETRNDHELTVFEEVFVAGAYPLSRLSFAPDTVIDCGGYAGYFTLLAAAKYPNARFMVFEPSALNSRAMQKNFKLNNLLVELRLQAVSNADGHVPFRENGFGSRLLWEESSSLLDAVVPVVNLREFIENQHSHNLLLKLDVEGEESVILPDLISSLPGRCAIFFEWHRRRRDFKAIEQQLQSEGFFVEECRARGQQREDHVYLDVFALRGN
jgi:FkbM family methyltransferase